MSMPRRPIPVGTKIGFLTVIGPGKDLVRSDGFAKTMTLCRCVCGKEVEISTQNLKKKTTLSCGCMRKSLLSKARTEHGESVGNVKLYRCWTGMRERCGCPSHHSYKNYGGRGISVCQEWGDYSAFAAWARSNGYREGLTIDRINVNGNYSPDNCRWVDWKTQANNKRDNHVLSIDGVEHTLQEWADLSGNSFSLILDRLNRGKSTKDAVFSNPGNTGPKASGTHGVMITAFGRTMNVKQWSEFLGVNRTTLSLNIKKGVSIEKFVSDRSIIMPLTMEAAK